MGNNESLSEEAVKILKRELMIDLGMKSFSADITSCNFINKNDRREFLIIPRQKVIVCVVNFVSKFIKDVSKKIKFFALCKDGDLVKRNQVIAKISGNSRNIINVLRIAKKLKIKSISLLGKGGGSCKKLSDYNYVVPSKSTANIQEVHHLIGHIFCSLVD